LQMARSDVSANSAEAVADIFSQVPPRHYHWDAQKKQAVTTYGNRADADEACRKIFKLTSERPEARPLYIQAALSWMCRKSSTDPHEYKFLAAILDEARLASAEWQPHILAASVHFLHGKQSPDYPAVQQAREALRTA